MITTLILNIIVMVVGVFFFWLPQITVLPTIGGYDIDTALVNGVGQMNTVLVAFWPIKHFMIGFGVLLGYFIIKMTLKFFLGHRAPTN